MTERRRAGAAFLSDAACLHMPAQPRDLTPQEQREASGPQSRCQCEALCGEVTTACAEVLATEEELRRQFDQLVARDQEIQRKNFLLQSLHEGMLHLLNHLDSEDILRNVLVAAATLAQTSHGFLYRVDEVRGMFRQTHGLGVHACCKGLSFPWHEGLAGEVYRTQALVLDNAYAPRGGSAPPPPRLDARLREQGFSFDEISAQLLIPLRAGGAITGLIGLSRYGCSRTFTREEVGALEQFADIASLALANSALLRSHQQELRERRKTEKALRQAQRANQALLDSIPDPLFVINREGKFIDYKARPEHLYLQPEQFLGKTLGVLFPPDVAATAMRHLRQALATKKLQTFEYRLDFNGEPCHYEARLVPNGTAEVLAIIRDITERRRLERQLRYQSLHDSLTATYNRAWFEARMQEAARERGRTVGLLICDVDGLKLINDTLGHAAGDEVLRHISRLLQQALEAEELLARIGGDEFAVLLYDRREEEFAAICRRVRAQVERYNLQHEAVVPISISLGYAVSMAEVPDMESLFTEADTNMYREKLHQKQSAKSSIVQALVKALEARDYLTEGHGDRLQGLMEAFSISLGLPEQQLADLRLLAHFHDIGKVGIPDHILGKPGPLSATEWVIMRQHAEIGYRIANSVTDLHPISEWILSHHEHWDGRGYSRGLAGEDIPLACRLLSLVDTYDAMTHDRPYRQAVTPEEALAELQRCAGSQFDPALTARFVEFLQQRLSRL